MAVNPEQVNVILSFQKILILKVKINVCRVAILGVPHVR
jgi:hypothetical protein